MLLVMADDPAVVTIRPQPQRAGQRPGLGMGVHLPLSGIKRDLRQALKHLGLRFRHQPGEGGADGFEAGDIEFYHDNPTIDRAMSF